MQPFIVAKQPDIVELCRTHRVRELYLFGSAVRDDFDPEKSDVDVRVIFAGEGQRGYTANYFNFKDKIEAILGRKVDVLSGSTIKNSCLRSEIEQSQVLLYAA